MVDFSGNIAVLRRWANAVPGEPLPANFQAWQNENQSAALLLNRKDPELCQLLNGTASADLVADAIQNLLSPTPVSQEEKEEAARKAEAKALYDASRSDEGLNLTQKLRLESAYPELAKKIKGDTAVAQSSEEEMVMRQRQDAAHIADVKAASRARSMAAFRR